MDFIFSIPTPPAAIVFSPLPVVQIGFIFSIPNTVIAAGSAGGTLDVYVNGVFDQTVAIADFQTEVVTIE